MSHAIVLLIIWIDCLVLSEHLFRCFNSNDSHSLVLLLPVPFLSWQLWIADICSKFQKNYCLTGHFLKSMWCMKDEVDRYMITCLSHITSVTLILDCVSVRQTFVCCHLPDRRKNFHSIFLKLVLIRTFWLVIDSSFFLLILILIYHFTWLPLTILIIFSFFTSYFYPCFNSSFFLLILILIFLLFHPIPFDQLDLIFFCFSSYFIHILIHHSSCWF